MHMVHITDYMAFNRTGEFSLGAQMACTSSVESVEIGYCSMGLILPERWPCFGFILGD